MPPDPPRGQGLSGPATPTYLNATSTFKSCENTENNFYWLDIVWDGGRTAKAATVGFHPRNLWPSVYMASNVKKKYKLIKKHLGRGNFVLFSNSENIPLFLSLNKIHATKYMEGYWVYIKCFILTLLPFSFIWVQIVEREILSQKFSFTDCFPLSLDTGPKMCYWWNLKS